MKTDTPTTTGAVAADVPSAATCACGLPVSAAATCECKLPPSPPLIRAATAEDARLLHRLITELATYESLSHEVESTPELHTEHLFGPRPRAYAILAFVRGIIPAGFAVWYPTYSTFAGSPGAFLEDLYVRPNFRRQNIGHALLTAAANAAAEDGCTRLEWRALKWNSPALEFYKSIGAELLSEWVTLRRPLVKPPPP